MTERDILAASNVGDALYWGLHFAVCDGDRRQGAGVSGACARFRVRAMLMIIYGDLCNALT